MNLRYTTLAAAAMLSLAMVPMTASAQCENLDERCTYPDEDPENTVGPVDCDTFATGDPEAGYVPLTEWYAMNTAETACIAGDGWKDVGLHNGGNVAWALGNGVNQTLGSGGDGGVDPGPFLADTTTVVDSLVWAACAAAVGPDLCGPEPVPDQTQECPSGLGVPNPGIDGVVGAVLDGSDAEVQASCELADEAGGAGPDPEDLEDIIMGTVGNVTDAVLDAPADVQNQATTGTFAVLDAVQADTCQVVFATPSCI